MDCRQVEQILDAYVACELPLDEAAQVREHLDSCRPCTMGAAEYGAALQALRSAGREAPAVDSSFYRALSDRLDRAAGPYRAPQPVRWRFVGSVAAAAAAVLIAAIYLIPSIDTGVPPSAQPGDGSVPVVSALRPQMVVIDTSGPYRSSAVKPGNTSPSGQVYLTSATTDGKLYPFQLSPSPGPFDIPVIRIRPAIVQANPFFATGGFVTAGDYRKLEGRLDGMQQQLKAIETRLTALESQDASPASR